MPLTASDSLDPWALDAEDPLDVPDWAAGHDTWYEVFEADIVGNDIEQVGLKKEATIDASNRF